VQFLSATITEAFNQEAIVLGNGIDHYSSLLAIFNKGQLMIVTTTDVIQGAIIESYLGIVTAEVVYGTNALRDFFAGIRDVIGGRTGSYERVFEKGQQDALAELQQRASRLGADAIIGIEIDTGTINIDQKGALLLITATGTAVKLASR
jgi:uncharacterized protein YbjQ (UPF0145 family)